MRKKLFAVIMSVMMMVTFMPAMAFATGEAKWDDNNQYWQAADGTKYTNIQKFINVPTAQEGEYNWAEGSVWLGAFDNDDNLVSGCTPKFLGYNLSTAMAAVTTWTDSESQPHGGTWKRTRTKFTKDEMKEFFGTESLVDATSVSFGLPDDVKMMRVNNSEFKSTEGKTINAATVQVSQLTDGTTALTDVSFKSTTPKYNPDKKYEDQPFTLYLNPYFTNGSDEGQYFYGETPERPITVVKSDSKKAADLDSTDYEFDGKALTVKPNYNGGEHKVVQKEYAGITSTYKLLNEKTGKYEDVEGDLVVKNAGKYHVIAKVTNANDSKDTKTIYFDIEVEKAYTAVVGFKRTNINVAGSFDAKDYLTAVATYEVTSNGAIMNSAKKKASEKAVIKDEETILAYFNEMYDIVMTDKGDGYQRATAEEKDLTAGEKKALEEKYEDLLGNYGYLTGSEAVEENAVATFKVIDNITFSKAPLAKTYKAKKGKLPKTKTFKVAAKAASGTALVYKIKSGAGKIKVNATSGKITVKKGLKKGTYKVGVYAITVDTFGGGADNWVEDHYTLKIKVK